MKPYAGMVTTIIINKWKQVIIYLNGIRPLSVCWGQAIIQIMETGFKAFPLTASVTFEGFKSFFIIHIRNVCHQK